MAFGDSYNDLDMIKYAGLGVAMANAGRKYAGPRIWLPAPMIKTGVVWVIEEYILGSG